MLGKRNARVPPESRQVFGERAKRAIVLLPNVVRKEQEQEQEQEGFPSGNP
jgi:hypothetical protein